MNGYVRILCVFCSTFHYSPTETAISNVSCAIERTLIPSDS